MKPKQLTLWDTLPEAPQAAERAPVAPEPQPPKPPKRRELVVHPRPHKQGPLTACGICHQVDRSPKPMIPWMGGAVHPACHDREMRRRRPEPWPLSKPPKAVAGPAAAVEALRRVCPVCEICGKAEGTDQIWVDAMWELRPGVKRGVVHRGCWDQLLREVGYAAAV